jgi:radical SAM superfamily enzyme YgiQ (UPF0313 family)
MNDVIFLTTNQNKTINQHTLIERGRGPYLLKHILEKNGYSCQVIDFISPNVDGRLDHNISDLKDIIKNAVDDNTLIVGLSLSFWLEPDLNYLFELLGWIKETYPKIKVLAGGAISMVKAKKVENYVDGLVRGYAEDIIIDLIKFYQGKEPEPRFFYDLPYKIKVYNESRRKDYSIVTCDFKHTKKDIMFEREALWIEMSRGCIFSCKFCNYDYLGKTKNDYIREIELLKQEILSNYENFGITHYTMVDSTFNESVEKLEAFALMVESLPFRPSFVAYIRFDLLYVKQEMIELLERCQLRAAFLGIETLEKNNAVLIGKGFHGSIKAKQFLEYLSKRWHKKIILHSNIIVGLPHETYEDLLKTKQFFKDIGLASWAFVPLKIGSGSSLMRFALSEFDRNSEKYGYKFDSKGVWYHDNGYWNFKKAEEVSSNLYKLLDETDGRYSVHPLHFLGPIITSGTYDIDQLVTRPKSELNWNIIDATSVSMIEQYRNRIKKLC